MDWGRTIGKLCLILGAATLAAMGFGAWYLIHDMQQHMVSAASEPVAGTHGSSNGGRVIVALVVLLVLRAIWKRLRGK